MIMKPENSSYVTEFILLGLTNEPDLQVLLFLLFLFVYVFTLLGNISILFIVWCSSILHTPMYFFLAQLSIVDISLSTVLSPKMLAGFLTGGRRISFSACIAQTYLFGACASTEFCLLAVMAYDRYVAIGNPLLYTVKMNKYIFAQLAIGSYIGGFLHSLIHAICLYQLSFCGPDVINHFACDHPVLVNLSCTDYFLNDLIRFIFTSILVAGSLSVIAVSYFRIAKAILRIRTTAGRRRAASTCISHFTCVFLFYGSCLIMEVMPNTKDSEEKIKVVAVINAILIPALNPVIYTLRNNEVKEALRKKLFKHNSSH
ncbi:olfactory receptor 5J3-like [Pleurodeles waltl]|uniref:olfactory receptor 5J3-like n=1 Tax=Pleurodeles waltl TaxID=8319 RepID=UPI003709462D